MTTIKLSGVLEVERPDVDFFIDKLTHREFFAYCKLNHAFWDIAASHHEVSEDEEYPAWQPQGWLALHGRELLDDLLKIVSDIPQTEILLAVSNLGPPDPKISEEVLCCRIPPKEMAQFILDQFPEGYPLYYGPLWKDYAIEGSLIRLMEAATSMPVIAVGLSHLEGLKAKLGIGEFHHVVVDYDATHYRHDLLGKIQQVRQSISVPSVIMFQTGESLSTWLIYHLRNMPDTFLIDVGRALDLWAFRPQGHKLIPDMDNQEWLKLVPRTKLF